MYLDERRLLQAPEGAYTWFHAPSGEHRMKVVWPDAPLDLDVPVSFAAGGETFVKLRGSTAHSPLFVETGVVVEVVEGPYALAEMRARCRFVPSFTGR